MVIGASISYTKGRQATWNKLILFQASVKTYAITITTRREATTEVVHQKPAGHTGFNVKEDKDGR